MRFLRLLIAMLLLTGCASAPVAEAPSLPPAEPSPEVTELPSPAPTEAPPDLITLLMAGLSVEEKVGQLLLARCPERGAQEALSTYHLGGFVLFGRDLAEQTPQTLSATLDSYRAACTLPPLIAVDEEGGLVTRVSSYPAFRDRPFPSPRALFREGGLEAVLAIEEEKAALLVQLGIHVNLGPVCDLATDPGAFLYSRSLGEDPETTGLFAARTAELYSRQGLGTVLKHFPGYGNCADTHSGIVIDKRSLPELAPGLIPFRQAMEAAPCAVMVSHVLVEALDGEYPASLSPQVHSYLRKDMGFDGVIITDDLAMEAITRAYGTSDAAVLAVLAGNDLICCTDYIAAYEAVLEAVQSGQLPIEVLDKAVYRVLSWKDRLGILFSGNTA